MQYLVIGYDGSDSEATNRRMAARPAHIALADEMRTSGNLLYGVAILDELGKMIGSVFICNFPSRDALDQWLAVEPYVTGQVWQKIDIKPCKVAPSFTNIELNN